jgi:hypothetical protein
MLMVYFSSLQNIIPTHSWAVDWGKDQSSTCGVREHSAVENGP